MDNNSFSLSDETSSRIENGISVQIENGKKTGNLDKNRSASDHQDNEVNTHYLCGAFNRYPKWLQRFANSRCFLIAYCIQNIIGGAEFTFMLGSTTSVEKHFQFSSGDIGLLVLLSEIGPIITSVLLSFMGGRGNRPRWLALGLITGSIGVFLNFSTFLFYPAPTLSESGLLGASSKKFCDLQDVINSQFLNRSSSTTSSLTSKLLEGEEQTCDHYRKFAFFIWLIGYTCKALAGTLIYTVGAPYLDDGISKNSSPIYFAISIAVRVLGPTIGFALSALALNTYVYPGENFGIKPNDPRWVGAWWIGPLIFSIFMFAYSFILLLFPRIMPKASSSSDVEGKSSVNDSHHDKALRDEELVRTSVVPKDELPSTIHVNGHSRANGRGNHERTNGHVHAVDDNRDTDGLAVINATSGRAYHTEYNGHVAPDGNDVPDNMCCSFIRKYLPENQQEGFAEFTSALKRLFKNPVVVYGALADFTALVAESGLFFWLAKYHEHQFRVTKSNATLFAGLSGTASLVLGVVGGGIWISKCRPRAKTVAYLMMSCGILYIFSLVGMMFITCDFQSDLPGILSTDAKSVDLYRGCSSGCECDRKEFIPVCIRDGPISLTYFSPCHAGCPDNSVAFRDGEDDVDQAGDFFNCTCGSPLATVTSGYCQDTCSGFITYNIVTILVKSLISVGAIGGTLISLRCVAVEDKAIALGVKATMISAALIVNPLIFGSLIDSSCLVWEETCSGNGSCWFYNTDDFRYKLHGMACFFFCFSVFFAFKVARNIGDLKLVDDDPSSTSLSSSSSSSLSSSSSPSCFFSSPAGVGRSSSIRRSLKKITKLMGGENTLSLSPGMITKRKGKHASRKETEQGEDKGVEDDGIRNNIQPRMSRFYSPSDDSPLSSAVENIHPHSRSKTTDL